MRATQVWFGNEQWPSGASPGAFARDVFRIEKCKTDKDRALAFYKWFLRCMCRGKLPVSPGFNGMLQTADPLTTLTWGHHQCTGWGWVAVEAFQANGMKTRRSVIANSGHTYYEVWYAGEDGREGWHAFDPFLGWYFLNERGEVASNEELAANPVLATRPHGGPSRVGHHPERSVCNYPYSTSDNLDIVQQLYNEETSYDLQVGQSYENLWRPEVADLAWGDKLYPHGAHCDISLYDESGKPRYPEHHPYWRHYTWPTPRTDGNSGGQPVRWHGCGALRWRPLLYAESVVARSAHAIFENGTVRPSGPNRHCEIWWHIKLPYQATHLRLTPSVHAAGNDLVGFAISPDNGKSIHTLHWSNGVPPKIITNGAAGPGNEPEGPSVRGAREFWLRLDMSSKSAQSPLRVWNLGVTVGYQLNMQILPRLVPGENNLYLDAGKLEGVRLNAEWAYTHPRGERTETLSTDKAGRVSKRVNPEISTPDEIVMRGCSIRCEAHK
ncbi:MAG TPA: hypothetical protein VEJ63_17625 [Planctomycetota bacterium]|nr:hypothetical protein [Planctomycetota bacterium]